MALNAVPPASPWAGTAQACAGVEALVRRLDLFTLKLFLSVIDEGQFGRAAAREHVVPSAATRRIQELEELAGTKLFDRSAKGVVPSPAGRVVARHARIVLTTLDAMRTELAAYSDGSAGYVSIAATRLLIVYFLAAEIGDFARRFPRMQVELREELYPGALRALQAGEVELGVYDTRVPESEFTGIQSRECRKDGLVAVMPANHPLASASSISLEILLDQDLIGTRPGSCLMANLRHAAHGIGRELRLKRSVDTLEAARSLVSAGLGVALQPASGMLPLDERDRVVAIPVQGEWAMLSYRVGWRVGKSLSPAAAALIEQLTRHELATAA
ncbi:LysR family transcriptional regulator [Variovorax guangxiensis]|uniref:LysR family transcriptional regulator n=1 Tax=Variovorax guangxiensis TaxID=1775474 RepID=UPI00285EE69B|nr:LysR family transcriptional regulator [Variovorax guangxiensis]MDR6858781.1 DNA-binding transcriptional LysR family regulator [Variovorax guangxiensis]